MLNEGVSKTGTSSFFTRQRSDTLFGDSITVSLDLGNFER